MISDFCFRTCCMTLVQKLGNLCLYNHERAKTGRRSPFYLNCSHIHSRKGALYGSPERSDNFHFHFEK